MPTNKLQGIGVGLRACHYPFIETERPTVAWFEVLSDNYFEAGGSHLFHLERIRAHYPMTLHGVGLSIGSTDPLDLAYLAQLKTLMQQIEPLLISDHLCWTALDGQYFHELLPLPYTEEAVQHVAQRILRVQEYLGQQIMIENVSSYLTFTHSTLSEWEFLQAIATEADCLILLDLNNIYVSAHNNQFAPEDYLNHLNKSSVAQFHLAGFQDHGTHLLDTHSTSVCAPVWELYKKAQHLFGPVPTAIEWDNDIPSFPQLLEEVRHATLIMENYAATL